MENRTSESVDLFRKLADIWMKIMITIVIVGIYAAAIIVLIVKVCDESPWQNNIILGAVDGLLTISMPIIVRHFFPKQDSQ